MKKLILLSIVLILCAQFSPGFAKVPTVNEEEIEAAKNAEKIPFSTPLADTFDAIDWTSSEQNRVALSVFLAIDLANAGYPEVSDGLLNFNSFVGKFDKLYIVAGMYEGYAFNIFYSRDEHMGVYQFYPTVLNEDEVEAWHKNSMSLSCSEYYENSRPEVVSYYKQVTSAN